MSNELLDGINAVATAFDAHKNTIDYRFGKLADRVDSLQDRIEAAEAARDRPKSTTIIEPKDLWFDRETGQPVLALG